MDVLGAISFLLVGLVICYPPIKAILIARKFNVRINLYDAFIHCIRKTASPRLFEAIGIAEENGLQVNPTDLEVHLIAGGNPVNVVEILIKYKSYSEISPKQVFAYDLSNMDFDRFATQLLKAHYVNLKELDFSRFKVDYSAVFKLSPNSLLLNEDSGDLGDCVQHRLQSLAPAWSSTDRQYTENFLKTQVFNEHFWHQEIKAKLISQSIIVND